MNVKLPEYYFRIRDNGAFVFRVDTGNRQQRIDLDQIATVNTRSGEIKPQGNQELSDTDKAAISDWLEERRAILAQRDIDDILRTIDHLNQTAHWVHSRATAEDLDLVTDRLLLAMHDLRIVLTRKKAERIMRGMQ